jgi:hypothetical protein
MEMHVKRLSFVLAVCGIGGVWVARAQPVPSQPGPDGAPSDSFLQAAYETHLAANVAAQASLAPSPLSPDDQLAASNFGCADGFQFWMRDALTPLCQPLCGTDADCGKDDGRCRILDVSDKSMAPPMLLVDDMSADEVEAALTNPSSSPPPIEICDPFWDVVGATDADTPATATL